MISFTEGIQIFLNYLTVEKNYSPLSAKSYASDLSQFASFLKNHYEFENINSVELTHVRSFISYLKQSHLDNASILRKASALKSFFNYLNRKKIFDHNPTVGLVLPKRKKKLPEYLDGSIEKKLSFLDDISDDFQTETEKIVFLLFYNTGIRRAELLGLKIKDVDLTQHKIQVLGKGNKIRWVPISKAFAERIGKYLHKRENVIGAFELDSYFFVSPKGEPYYEKKVYRIVKKILGMVTTMNKRSPHILRHTFATQLLNNGAGINDIKELLGHANLSATQIYTHSTIENLKKTYKKFHPKA